MILQPTTSSGNKTASVAIYAGPGRLRGANLFGDGTNSCTLTIYDNASAASGTVLAKLQLQAAGNVDELDGSYSIVATKGIYASLSGSGSPSFIVYFEPTY